MKITKTNIVTYGVLTIAILVALYSVFQMQKIKKKLSDIEVKEIGRTKDSLIENSKILGDYFISALKSIDNKIIKEVRGKGLWIGMELNKSKINAKDLCLMLLNEGLLCKETHKSVIRFAPPLMISKDQLDWAINKIIRVISSI